MTISSTTLDDDWTFAQMSREETLWGPHGYHRYPAKFIPQLVHRLIASYSTYDDLVGDPFVGSATTGVEALRMGRRFWGGDVNEVALLMSRAKCSPLPPDALDATWRHLSLQLQSIPRISRRRLTGDERAAIVASSNIARASREERLAYWFPLPHRVNLEHVLQAILTLPDEPCRTLFLCGFSNILKRCSIWLSGSTKVQKDLDKLLVDPVDEFCKQCRDMLKRNTLYWNQLLVDGIEPSLLLQKWSIQRHDARYLPMLDATFDLLVTSPPYATCYEYKEIHQLTQLWFERYGLVDTQDENECWIGSKVLSQRTRFQSDLACEASILSTGSFSADCALKDLAQLGVGSITQSVKREVRALHHYFRDMFLVLGEFARVIMPGKYVILIIGNSYRRGIAIPTSLAVCEMAQRVGLELERRVVRQIPNRVLVSTRNKTTGCFSSVAQSDIQVYPEEDILIFKRL